MSLSYLTFLLSLLNLSKSSSQFNAIMEIVTLSKMVNFLILILFSFSYPGWQLIYERDFVLAEKNFSCWC